MEERVYYLFTTLITFASVALSFASVWVSRTKVVTSAISSNRIEWIGEVRALVWEFILEYKKNSVDKTQMRLLATHIMLYLNRSNKDYCEFVESIRICIKQEYTHENCMNLINSTQRILNSVWKRMKREAGVKQHYDSKITRMLDKEKKGQPQFTNVI